MELEKIKNSILEIRGKKIILDFELAKMYQVETKYLKRTVRNNLKRFPKDFMFELTINEWNNLRCNFSTSKNAGGIRYLPFAFTEQGVAMLSGLLNSDIAIEMNIAIMRAFVMMRQFALTYQELSEKLVELEKLHNQKFDDIEQVLTYLIQKDKQQIQQANRKEVGYK
ncbi:MAG: ORF6N domain-containing protein, partial [Bacteroidetes bacterium]|nr:ORF6N domain-containing protein [Bacteroidota bacterium]